MVAEKRFTVSDLIKELEKLPQDFNVELSVRYDNCEHIQQLGEVISFKSSDIDWILLRGAKE